MNYWLKDHPDFVSCKYGDLKSELLQNQIRKLEHFGYDSLYCQARQFSLTKYVRQGLTCNRVHDWMEIDGKQLLARGSVMSVPHLLVILSYTNYTKLQYEFKRQGFRTLDANETESDVRARNREIANWCRLLMEGVHCFGSVMSKRKRRFHGINARLLVFNFEPEFQFPISLTTSWRIAKNFATESGIVLVMKHGGLHDTYSLELDVSDLSKFSNEKGQFISFLPICFLTQ